MDRKGLAAFVRPAEKFLSLHLAMCVLTHTHFPAPLTGVGFGRCVCVCVCEEEAGWVRGVADLHFHVHVCIVSVCCYDHVIECV